ncbi:hypothetical protein [Mycobacterium haemophilum]|uniref:hypothetical protein n=1 Tax=Mycobacterium haemophilum TaxID=29311 RepID=UPI000A74DC47|nr:hypothetical protein [Mycobacterium haemophilum]
MWQRPGVISISRSHGSMVSVIATLDDRVPRITYLIPGRGGTFCVLSPTNTGSGGEVWKEVEP